MRKSTLLTACVAALAGVGLSAGVNYAATATSLTGLTYTVGAGVVDSPHNMNRYLAERSGGANTGDNMQRVCIFCHTPHNSAGTDQARYNPLWNHANTGRTEFLPYQGFASDEFPDYDESTFDGMKDVDQWLPNGVTNDVVVGPSRLCMSCHDGVTAVDSFGGATGTLYDSAEKHQVGGTEGSIVIAGEATDAFGMTGGDLRNDHPIGFRYDYVAANDGQPATDHRQIRNADDTNLPAATFASEITSIRNLLYKGERFTCASCHDVHNKSRAVEGKLLVGKMDGSKLCLGCHLK